MRDQLVSATYNEATGVSTVKLNTKYGTFEHSVVVAPEDKDVANKFDGCKFAEYLCQIDKLRAKARAFRERAIGIDHAANVLCAIKCDPKMRLWNVSSDDLLELRIQAEIAYDQARVIKERADKMKDGYAEFVESTLNARRKFREHAKKDSE